VDTSRINSRLRYRVEGDETCIDVKIRTLEHMFDNRDPAPFRERDLDPDLAEYLRDAAEDLIGVARIRIVIWLEIPCAPGEIEQAFHAHFEGDLERIRRGSVRRRRKGQIALLVGVVLLVTLLSLGRLISKVVPDPAGAILGEGLTVASWVVLWRPFEFLLYDWIPVRHERRLIEKLLAAPVELRTGAGLVKP
jgi:hypothetical protein